MRWIVLSLFLASSSTLLSASPAAAAQKEFTMRFFGAFLEPGIGAGPAAPGDELQAAQLTWTSDTTGRLVFTQWRQTGLAEFTTTPDRRTLLSLRTNMEDAGKPMDVWRLRHGYKLDPSRGYFWASLEDVPPSMDAATGKADDRFLQAVWKLWVERRVRALLAGNAPAPLFADPGQLEQKVVLSYDRSGLIGTPTLRFHYRFWHMPVKVEFKLTRKKPTHHDPSIIGILGPVLSSSDADEMRRRHGFKKGTFGYALDKDFPEAGFNIREFGPKLDQLLGAAQLYWAEATANIIVSGLDSQLQEAVAAHPAPAARPVFMSLQNAAVGGL